MEFPIYVLSLSLVTSVEQNVKCDNNEPCLDCITQMKCDNFKSMQCQIDGKNEEFTTQNTNETFHIYID